MFRLVSESSIATGLSCGIQCGILMLATMQRSSRGITNSYVRITRSDTRSLRSGRRIVTPRSHRWPSTSYRDLHDRPQAERRRSTSVSGHQPCFQDTRKSAPGSYRNGAESGRKYQSGCCDCDEARFEDGFGVCKCREGSSGYGAKIWR